MKVVVLAFDGVSSKDVIDKERFVLGNFRLQQTEKIDLKDRPFYLTSELFTDLITGTYHEEHGVRDLVKYSGSDRITRFEPWLKANYYPVWDKTRKYREGLYKLLEVTKTKWERSDIQTETIFANDNVYQEQIPVYDWRKADPLQVNKGKDNFIERSNATIKKEWEYSKKAFYGDVKQRKGVDAAIDSEHEDWAYFQHFHFVDWMQHLYRSKPESYDGDWDSWFLDAMQDYWWSANEFVKEAQDYLDSKIDDDYLLIVMSDHGIPEKQVGHRPNAFVSCNREILPENPELKTINRLVQNRV